MTDTSQAVYDAVRSRLSNCDVGSAIAEALRQSFDISFAVEGIKQDFYVTLDDYRRPSVLFRPKVFPDGNQWCALYGENLQEGVAGFGSTPSAAMHDFDKNWQSMKLVKGVE